MLEKFLNQKVQILATLYGAATMKKGTITAIDENFIELDNSEIVAIKAITTVKPL